MDDEEIEYRPLTNKTLELVLKFRQELIEATNGYVFEDSAKLLRKERIKRTKYLMEAATGKPFELDEEDLAEMDEDDLAEMNDSSLSDS